MSRVPSLYIVIRPKSSLVYRPCPRIPYWVLYLRLAHVFGQLLQFDGVFDILIYSRISKIRRHRDQRFYFEISRVRISGRKIYNATFKNEYYQCFSPSNKYFVCVKETYKPVHRCIYIHVHAFFYIKKILIAHTCSTKPMLPSFAIYIQ